MAAPLHELFRVCAETAARVNSHLLSGAVISDAMLSELASSQSMCLEALHARLRQKASMLGLAPLFISRSPSQAFVSDFDDRDQCMQYTVKCCEDCRTPEQMRQLVPLLRCFQSDAPNNSALTPLFVKMGGLVAVLAWAKRTAIELKTSPSSHGTVVLIGVLHVVSKFNVLPKETVPTGACKLLLDIMGCRLPPISACVGAVLRCWMKCAERNAKEITSAASKLKVAAPASRWAALPPDSTRSRAPCASVVAPSRVPSCSADSGVIPSRKFVAELCEDETDGENCVQQSKRPCNWSHFPVLSKRPATITACGAPPVASSHPHAPPKANIRHTLHTVHASGSLEHARDTSQSSVFSTPFTPPAFDASSTVQALETLAALLQHDSCPAFMSNAGMHPPQHALPLGHYSSPPALDYTFTELFAPPALHDSDFFYSDDQFYADDVNVSSDAINRAFIQALQEFSQRDELIGLQSLCARFRT
jgi:hypothetical protein